MPEGLRYPTTEERKLKIEPGEMWASPSTLHLKLTVTSANGSWCMFKTVHIPIEDLPPEVVRALAVADVEDVGLDEPLWGVPYSG